MDNKIKNNLDNLELKIPSNTKYLSVARDFISDAAHKFGFDEETVNKIVLAVDEACSNIIKHAYHYAEDKSIELSIFAKNNTFEIVIIDHGDSFNPATIKPPQIPDYIQHYNKGGLGMYLMRSLVDKIEYDMDPGNKNLVRLVKYK